MDAEMEDLLDVLVSEFEDSPFTMEDAMDYVGFGEIHLIEGLIARDKLVRDKEGLLRIKNVELYYGDEEEMDIPTIDEIVDIINGEKMKQRDETEDSEEEREELESL